MKNLYTNNYSGARCSLTLGSMTEALKARRILSRAGITVTVKKLATDTSRGCVYGIEFSCELLGNVRDILGRNGVEI